MIDLDQPQHFTKEQSEWIKEYCRIKNREFYNKAIDDFVKLINEMPIYEDKYGEKMPMPVEMMAEQLKKGKVDDRIS